MWEVDNIRSTRSTVSMYDIGGWVKDLPDLNTGREDHGCGHYVDTNNDIVRLVLYSFLLTDVFRSIWLLEDGMVQMTCSRLKYCKKDPPNGQKLNLYLLL